MTPPPSMPSVPSLPSASRQRNKLLSTTDQTAKFLYTIIKQLDLKGVNWEIVAEGLGITNGHAARMRYSRFKSQIEGTAAQPKPRARKQEGDGKKKAAAKRKQNEDVTGGSTITKTEAGDQKRVKTEHVPYTTFSQPQPTYSGGYFKTEPGTVAPSPLPSTSTPHHYQSSPQFQPFPYTIQQPLPSQPMIQRFFRVPPSPSQVLSPSFQLYHTQPNAHATAPYPTVSMAQLRGPSTGFPQGLSTFQLPRAMTLAEPATTAPASLAVMAATTAASTAADSVANSIASTAGNMPSDTVDMDMQLRLSPESRAALDTPLDFENGVSGYVLSSDTGHRQHITGSEVGEGSQGDIVPRSLLLEEDVAAGGGGGGSTLHGCGHASMAVSNSIRIEYVQNAGNEHAESRVKNALVSQASSNDNDNVATASMVDPSQSIPGLSLTSNIDEVVAVKDEPLH